MTPQAYRTCVHGPVPGHLYAEDPESRPETMAS
jgi:hypothetical protein